MAMSWQKGILFVGGVALGAAAGVAGVFALRDGGTSFALPTTHVMGAAPAAQPAAAPASALLPVVKLDASECELSPVLPKKGSDDGRISLQPHPAAGSAGEVASIILTGKEADASGRQRDAEVAFLNACHTAALVKGDAMPLADAMYQLARHYANSAAFGAQPARELYARAEHLYSASLLAYQARLGTGAEKTKFAAEGLKTVQQVTGHGGPVVSVAKAPPAAPPPPVAAAQPPAAPPAAAPATPTPTLAAAPVLAPAPAPAVRAEAGKAKAREAAPKTAATHASKTASAEAPGRAPTRASNMATAEPPKAAAAEAPKPASTEASKTAATEAPQEAPRSEAKARPSEPGSASAEHTAKATPARPRHPRREQAIEDRTEAPLASAPVDEGRASEVVAEPRQRAERRVAPVQPHPAPVASDRGDDEPPPPPRRIRAPEPPPADGDAGPGTASGSVGTASGSTGEPQ
jgi:hypothetical protein